MVPMLSILVFSGAFTAATGVMVLTVGPQWRRVVRLAMGHVEPSFAPLATLATAERRIAIRRWASIPAPASVPAAARQLRAA